MSYLSFLPFLYLILGFFFFSRWDHVKHFFAAFLTNFLIPAAIISSLSQDFINAILITGFFFFLFWGLLLLGKKWEKTQMESLYFSYLNLGWLGIPISVIFLTEAQTNIILSAYVGSAIWGNTIGVYTLASTTRQLSVLSLLKQPTVIAVILGVIFGTLPIDMSHIFSRIEDTTVLLMSFFGMSVLGMWLKQTPFDMSVVKQSAFIQLRRFLAYSVVTIICYTSMVLVPSSPVINIDFIWALLFIACLPPAVNIIVLETYYCSTGQSATWIASGTIISLFIFFILFLLKISLNGF